MPKLPSGLELAITRDALLDFDHGGNWFACPEGHFWYWIPAPEMGDPPYALGSTIETCPAHAPAPRTREEAKRFIRVVERCPDGYYAWRGEWLDRFPRYTRLSHEDANAWRLWLERPETAAFLDETVGRCQLIAAEARKAQGRLVVRVQEDAPPDAEGWVDVELRGFKRPFDA